MQHTLSPWARRWVALVAVPLAALACRDAQFDATVRRALLCEECVEGQVAALVAYGDMAVPRMVNELRGPSQADVLQHQRLVAAEWQAIRVRRTQLDSAHLASDSTAVATRASAALVTSYQKQVLYVLYRIGTPKAKLAIRAAFAADSAVAGTILKPAARAMADSLRRL